MATAFGASPVAEEPDPARAARRFDALLTLLFIALAMGGTALVLVRSERDALHDPVQKAARGEVFGTTGLSLVAPANLTRAFAAVQRTMQPDEQLTNLRLAPTRLDVDVRNTVGRQRAIQVGVDLKARVLSDSGTSSGTGPRSLASIDAQAPRRFVEAVMQRTGYPPKTLDYLVYDVDPSEGGSVWDAFFVNVPIERNHFAADAHGRVIER